MGQETDEQYYQRQRDTKQEKQEPILKGQFHIAPGAG
jgi:hypothetical protein